MTLAVVSIVSPSTGPFTAAAMVAGNTLGVAGPVLIFPGNVAVKRFTSTCVYMGCFLAFPRFRICMWSVSWMNHSILGALDGTQPQVETRRLQLDTPLRHSAYQASLGHRRRLRLPIVKPLDACSLVQSTCRISLRSKFLCAQLSWQELDFITGFSWKIRTVERMELIFQAFIQ